MKITDFEEWFAIRSNNTDDDHWPARLTFNLSEGIHLLTARFMNGTKSSHDMGFHKPTITGWLDYQRPATLIRPLIQSVDGFSLGIDTPAMRASYRLVADAVLKNVFLEDVNEKIFTGIRVEHPAVHAWINPNLVDHDWSTIDGPGLPFPSVQIAPPKERTFQLQDGTEATITSATRTPNGENLVIDEYSILNLRFPAPLNYNDVNKIIWRIGVIFEFMIGLRTEAPVYQLPTTHTRSWNNKEREVTAELWYIPSRKPGSVKPLGHASRRLTLENRSSVNLDTLLNHATGIADELIYLAQVIQTTEEHELPLHQSYVELIGCLEDFDNRQFGSGSDPAFRGRMRSIQRIIKKHGSQFDQQTFKLLRGRIGNKYSLIQRLERLHGFWRHDDFRASPDLSRIRDLRNLMPHGRGLEISSDTIEEMVVYIRYLTALGRYHVFRALGFSGNEIGVAFRWQAHRYGVFVPEYLRPK